MTLSEKVLLWLSIATVLVVLTVTFFILSRRPKPDIHAATLDLMRTYSFKAYPEIAGYGQSRYEQGKKRSIVIYLKEETDTKFPEFHWGFKITTQITGQFKSQIPPK